MSGAERGYSPTPGRQPAAPFRAGALWARRRRADPPAPAGRPIPRHPQAGGPRRYAPTMTALAPAGRVVLLAPGILSP
jgi:hypothetical protein